MIWLLRCILFVLHWLLIDFGDFFIDIGDSLIDIGDFFIDIGDFLIEFGDFLVVILTFKSFIFTVYVIRDVIHRGTRGNSYLISTDLQDHKEQRQEGLQQYKQ